MIYGSSIPKALAVASCATTILAEGISSGFLPMGMTRHINKNRPLRREENATLAYGRAYGVDAGTAEYLIELNLGTPNQTVAVTFDTGSIILWVNPECSTASEGQQQLCQKACERVIDDSEPDAAWIRRLWLRLEVNLQNVTFGVGYVSEDMSTGILGSAINPDADSYVSFVEELVLQNVTNFKVFSVGLGSLEEAEGSVIFGGIDTKKFIGDLHQFPILNVTGQDPRYYIALDSVGATDHTTGQRTKFPDSNITVILDTGSTLSYLPDALLFDIAAQLDVSFNRSLGQDVMFVDCAAKKYNATIDFTFGKLAVQVPLSAFILDDVAPGYCIVGAITTSMSAVNYVYILGQSFLRSVYAVFDQDNLEISLAPYAKCGTNEKEILAGEGEVAKFKGECK